MMSPELLQDSPNAGLMQRSCAFNFVPKGQTMMDLSSSSFFFKRQMLTKLSSSIAVEMRNALMISPNVSKSIPDQVILNVNLTAD